MRGLAILVRRVPLVGSGFIALTGLVWGVGLQCDESCTGDGWQHTAGAPQWTLLTILGFVVFTAGISLFTFVCRGRPWHALGALAAGAAVLASVLGMSEGNLWEDVNPVALGALALVLLAGLFAALLCAPEER
jgi:hypothetical protein